MYDESRQTKGRGGLEEVQKRLADRSALVGPGAVFLGRLD